MLSSMEKEVRKYNAAGYGFALGFGWEPNHFGIVVDTRYSYCVSFMRLRVFGKTLVEKVEDPNCGWLHLP